MPHVQRRTITLAACALACLASLRPALAYVDLAPTIGKVMEDSKSIAIMEVTAFDRQKRTITFKQIKLLKGDADAALLKQQVAETDSAIIPRAIVQWAEPGAQAVVFSTARTAIVCIGQSWYQLRQTGTSWKLGPDRPELALAYYGSVSRLQQGVEKMLAGRDAILTMMPHGDGQSPSFDLSLNHLAYPGLVKVQRLRANLKMPGTVWAVSSSPNYMIGMGPVDEEELPALVKQLDAAEASARAAAIEDIRELTDIVGAAKTRNTVGALEKRLADTSPRVRSLAAATILRITHGHDAALKVLSESLASDNRDIRRDAATAAAITGKAGAPLVPALTAMLKDEDDSTRFAALQAIGTLGSVAASARDAIVPLLQQDDFMIDAADALGRLGPRAQPVPPKMIEMLQSTQANVRLAALRGMCQIGGKEALPAAEYIEREVGTMNEIDAYNMCELLALLGPIASGPASRIKTVPMPNPVVVNATNWAINAPAGLPWIGESTAQFGEIGTLVWASYITELGERLRPCALVLAPKIIAGKAGDVPDWGYKILNAAPEESIATIAPHLADKDKAMRERAAITLGRMGPPAAAASPKLQAAIAAATDDRERNLLQWSLREITKD